MTLVRTPTELTTAATDLVLAALAASAWLLLRRDGPDGLRGLLWRMAAAMLAVTAFLGAIAHGLALGEAAFVNIWRATYLGLSLLVAAMQASGAVSFTLVWPFDHNGVFHLVQMIGIPLLVHGLRAR
jgi:hypothetical protein